LKGQRSARRKGPGRGQVKRGGEDVIGTVSKPDSSWGKKRGLKLRDQVGRSTTRNSKKRYDGEGDIRFVDLPQLENIKNRKT